MTIEKLCTDCGDPFHSERTARRCVDCRFTNAHAYLLKEHRQRIYTRKCAVCDEQFAPLHNQTDHLCAKHDPGLPSGFGGDGVAGTCEHCNEYSSTLLSETITVCTACAKNPEFRYELYDKLITAQQERQQAPGATERRKQATAAWNQQNQERAIKRAQGKQANTAETYTITPI